MCFLSFDRSLSQDRSSPSPWAELLAQPHKHKELSNYCSLLQEHYHQSYVRGNLLYKTLGMGQRSYRSISIASFYSWCKTELVLV